MLHSKNVNIIIQKYVFFKKDEDKQIDCGQKEIREFGIDITKQKFYFYSRRTETERVTPHNPGKDRTLQGTVKRAFERILFDTCIEEVIIALKQDLRISMSIITVYRLL